MLKRVLSVVLAALFCLPLLPMSAAADDRPIRDSGTTRRGINWTLYMDGTLVLSPKDDFQTYWIDFDDVPWQSREYTVNGETKNIRDLVTALVVEDHVGIITSNLFFGYYNLTDVTLPGMYEIPNATFWKCYALQTVTVRGSTENIGNNAFQDCDALKTVTVHGSAGNIGIGAFSGCKRLKNFFVDGTVRSVGAYAFWGCKALQAFDAPVTGNIAGHAFRGCESLSRFSPLRGSVGDYAFLYEDEPAAGMPMSGSNLYIVSGHTGTLGSMRLEYNEGPIVNDINLIYTGTEAEFSDKYTNNSGFRIKAYQRLGDHVYWTLDEDGVLSITGYGPTIDLLDQSEQPWANVPGKGTWDDQREAIKKVRVERSVELGTHMLDYLENKVEYTYEVEGTLGDLHWGINRNTLYISGTGDIPNMYGRENEAWMPHRQDIYQIVIEDGITAVGFGAFSDCGDLTRVTLSDSVKRIDGGVFYGCMDLSQIDLPEGLTTIGRNAFTDCESLQTIYIPRSVTSIGSQAFLGSGLTDIYFGGNLDEWAALKVAGIPNVTVHPSYHSPQVGSAPGAVAEEPLEAEPTSQSELVSPDTGDSSHPALWIALMLLALGAAAVLAKKQRAIGK